MTLVLGGVRSGKSRHAEALVTEHPGPWTYIATGQAFDPEMRERINQHRAGRASGWQTVEAPLLLPAALRGAEGPVLVDCLTLWLSNLLMKGEDVEENVAALEAVLALRAAPTVLVSNEVGLGIVPDSALGRRFRDEAGILHQRIASMAEKVLFVVAGLVTVLK